MAQGSKKHRVVIIAVPIAAIVLLILGIVFYTQNSIGTLNQNTTVTPSGPISFNFSIVSNGIATYNNAQALVPYVVTKYSVANATGLSLFFGVYARNPLPNIYYINTTNYCYQCYNQSSLIGNLTSYLKEFGLITSTSTFNYIKPSQLNSIPHNSIIIVPSGLIPVYMIPGTAYPINGSASILTLLNRSDTLIYIGTNFTQSSGPGGLIFSNSNATVSILNAVGLGTTNFANPNPSESKTYFNQPKFGFVVGAYYGDVSYINTYNGSIVAFTNTQKAGWKNTSAIGYDIARIISTHFWLTSLASASYSTYQISNQTIGIPALTTSIINNQSTVGKVVAGSYSLLTAVVFNSTGVIERAIPLKIPLISNGSLGIQSYLGQTQIVPIQISIDVNSSKPVPVQPHIDLYTKNMTFVTGIPLPFLNITSNSPPTIKPYGFVLPSGTYIAVLRNFYNKYYSSAVFNVTNVTLSPVSMGFKNGTFIFYLESNNQAITNTSYSIDLNGAYKSSGNITTGFITYTLPKGTVIGYGTERFNLEIFNSKYSYTTQNIQQVLNIPTIYIEFVIVGLAILILNLIVKPPNRDEYYIDVPEFQQAKKIDVKVNRSEVISVFDKVNFIYHWKFMPLSLEEIKSGIGNNIRYNNIPVSITLQNVALIMSKLALDGDIVSANGYYAPKRWVNDSGHNVEYLSVFRRIRDYCVGHAILFTDVGASDIADMILSKGGGQTRVVIYTTDSGMRKIDVSARQKTYIVFSDEEKMLGFSDKLYKSYGNQAEMLKIGVSYGYIRLVEAGNLDQIVF